MQRATWIRRTIIATLVVIVVLPAVTLGGFRAAAVGRETRTRTKAAPISGRFVRAADVEMHVQETGPADGPPVLLIHGTGAWSEIWRKTLDTLASRGFHAVAVDMPPFGYSERPANVSYSDESQARRILGVIEGLGLANVTLVGHSFGGRPTMTAFLLDPSRVSALVLVDVALGLDTAVRPATLPWPARAALAVSPLRNGLVSATLTNPMFTGRLLRGLVADTSAVTPERVVMLRRPHSLEGTTASFGAWLRPFLTVSEKSPATDRSRYASIRVPTLVVWGDRDVITPIAQGKDLVSLIPEATWAELAGVGHIPAIEATDRFNDALLSFLERNRRKR